MAVAARSRRLSTRAVLREAATDHRSRFWLLLVAAIIVFIPIGLLEALSDGLQDIDLDEADAGTIAAAIGAAAAFAVSATLGDIFYTGVVAAIVSEERGGARHEIAELARNLPYGRLVVIDLIFALIVAAGLLLLVVPGLIAFAWYALAAPVVKIEGGSVANAFRRSRELVRGSTVRVLALLLPAIVLGDLLAELIGGTIDSVLGHEAAVELIGSLSGEVLTAPVFALIAVVTTHHLIALKAGREPAIDGGG
jgi:hypothetical protein